jgi:exodeoxyribonuclease VII small subunit
MDFEKSLNRLEEIVTDMEGGKLSLEESMKLFEEGVRLSRQCQVQLGEAEQKVQLLLQVDESGAATTKDFEETNED